MTDQNDPALALARRLGLVCGHCRPGSFADAHRPCHYCSGTGLDPERVEILREGLDEQRERDAGVCLSAEEALLRELAVHAAGSVAYQACLSALDTRRACAAAIRAGAEDAPGSPIEGPDEA